MDSPPPRTAYYPGNEMATVDRAAAKRPGFLNPNQRAASAVGTATWGLQPSPTITPVEPPSSRDNQISPAPLVDYRASDGSEDDSDGDCLLPTTTVVKSTKNPNKHVPHRDKYRQWSKRTQSRAGGRRDRPGGHAYKLAMEMASKTETSKVKRRAEARNQARQLGLY